VAASARQLSVPIPNPVLLTQTSSSSAHIGYPANANARHELWLVAKRFGLSLPPDR